MTKVAEFHKAFDLPAPPWPPLRPDPDLVRLRMRLIREEYEEVMEELSQLARATDPEKVVELLRNTLKELVDLCYVAEGAAVSLGLPYDAAYKEVHKSNMSKLGADGNPIRRPDGKVLKGPNYQPADMRQFVGDIHDGET